MDDWDDEQGVRAEPLVVSIILIVMSCILTQVALTLDNWASMDAEIVVSSEDQAEAEEFGFEIPEISMTTSFGLDEMNTKMNSDDGEEVGISTVTLEELAMVDSSETNDDMDFAKWYTAGKTTSIALWVGFSIGIIGAILALLSAFKGQDSVQSGAIVLCGISAAMLTAGWINWIAFGGSFGGESSADDLLTSDGFGPSFGFFIAIGAGILMTPVPFILAWSQQLPIDKLLPLKGGFESLEMRELTPTGKLNATIAATLACALLLSVAGQGVGATFLTPDATISQSDDDAAIFDDPDVEWWYVTTGAAYYELEEERTIPMNDDDSWRMDYQIVKDSDRNKPGAFESGVDFNIRCVDDTGATSDQNVDEQTDTVDVLLTANNGQELMVEGIECDGQWVPVSMEHQDIQQMYEWWAEVNYDSDENMEIWFHSEESVNDAIDNAPIIEWLQPISFEIFSDTKGETLGQNMDDNLEVEIDYIVVGLSYWEAEFWGMSPESTFPHSHYESEE
jgi:hypothetical protein